jgi:PKHD-type hydroxylase
MIVNDTKTKSLGNYPYCYYKNVFSNDEFDNVLKYLDRLELNKSWLSGETKSIRDDVRKSKSNLFRLNEDNYFIFNKFNIIIDYLNINFFNYDLIGYDYIQYAVYESKENSHFDWHQDASIKPSQVGDTFLNRKLSISFLLNDDFDGGNFEFNFHRECDAVPIEIEKNSLIAFPSYRIHRIKPVTKGVRKSLVIWVEGPKFK